MAGLRQCMKLGQASLRRISTNTPVRSIKAEDTTTFKKLKAKQELLQREDTIEEVHLKGGMVDVLLYKFAIGGTVVGLLLDFHLMYNLANDL